ncbi:iron ABC transporter permease [Bacillus sp. FJAT-26390]|uniref:FecCD family ABC transporter permease n=1 Tax=Bacillus sp. FJAT-26390 TaxID=1743142 RepID=UPI000807EE85|nr:iron ABC transporter permease [Bacillus sp. FJAT-26390]OBZ16545.1 ferrichrome ABC transporter permease [Bacillus sp. FJAT-26390]
MTGNKTWKTTIWFAAAFAALLMSIFWAISSGAKELSLATVWSAVFHYDPALTAHQIMHEYRIPRVLGAVITGMAFAVAGALMQGVTRNPMADAGILGVNAGAALSTLLIVLLGSATQGGLHSIRLTIAGAVVAAILHSFSSGIAIYYDLSQDLAFWYAGGVAGVKWEHLKVLAPLVFLVIAWATTMGRSISFLSLGDETAASLGIHTGTIKVLGMAAAVILAGASVSAAGSIGFVGLVVPHIARRFMGVDYRKIIPFSALLGAILLVWADFASRMVNPPREFAIGAMVALVGVPFFLYLARKERREL